MSLFTANLGDMSTDPELRCYCPTNDTCLKKGIMDLTKCVGQPIMISLPHFYDTHPSYLEKIRGLRPSKEDHAIFIYFESVRITILLYLKVMHTFYNIQTL